MAKMDKFNYIVIIQIDSLIPGRPISIATYSDWK